MELVFKPNLAPKAVYFYLEVFVLLGGEARRLGVIKYTEHKIHHLTPF